MAACTHRLGDVAKFKKNPNVQRKFGWGGWLFPGLFWIENWKKNKKLNYKGPCRVKKNSRHPKNIWIEPTPPTHPLPNFFLRGGEINIIKDFNFLGGFPIFCPIWPGYNHPPTSKLSLNVWIFFIFATSLKQYQHYIPIKKKQTTGLYYLFIYSTLITRGSTYKIEHARALKRPY